MILIVAYKYIELKPQIAYMRSNEQKEIFAQTSERKREREKKTARVFIVIAV